jgi:hypothetical protein
VSQSESPAVTRRTVVTLLAVLAVTSACGYPDGVDDEPVRPRRDPREHENQPEENEGENEPDENEGESEPDENEGENEPDENEDENEPDENEPDENGSDEGGDGGDGGESGEDEPEEPSGPGAGKCAENPGECEQGS